MQGGTVVGTGIDLVELNDIRKARFKRRFAEYFLTEEELRQIPTGSHEVQFLASRFALKEAVIKGFPEKLTPFDFRIEKPHGRPVITFIAPRHTAYEAQVSLTHTAHFAAAVAIIIKV